MELENGKEGMKQCQQMNDSIKHLAQHPNKSSSFLCAFWRKPWTAGFAFHYAIVNDPSSGSLHHWQSRLSLQPQAMQLQ